MENKQVVIPQFGAPEVLSIQTVQIPEAQPGYVVVKVAFAGVNPIDVKTRAGLGWAAAENKDNLPWVLGYDIAGSVHSVGDGTDKFEIGDKVAGFIGFPLARWWL